MRAVGAASTDAAAPDARMNGTAASSAEPQSNGATKDVCASLFMRVYANRNIASADDGCKATARLQGRRQASQTHTGGAWSRSSAREGDVCERGGVRTCLLPMQYE